MSASSDRTGRHVGGFDVWRKVMAARSTATPSTWEPDAPSPASSALRRSGAGSTPGTVAIPSAASASPAALAALPRPPADPRAPMGSADLVFGDDGRVAWGEIWEDFCELALIGGPPHRGTLLEAPGEAAASADTDGLARVREEIARGLAQTTGWPVVPDVVPGWVGLRCPDEDAAAWMALAILAENVDARQDGATLLVPAGPAFTLKAEIKNVVTAVAKSWHFWARHGLR